MKDTSKRRELVKDLSAHGVVTLFIAVGTYLAVKDIYWAILALAGGILIDLDHLVDYVVCYGWRLNIRDFLFSRQFEKGKFYVFLHSWELVAVLWLGAYKINIITPLVLAMTAHLLIDQFYTTRKNPYCYFFYYRWKKGFDPDSSIKDGRHKEKT